MVEVEERTPSDLTSDEMEQLSGIAAHVDLISDSVRPGSKGALAHRWIRDDNTMSPPLRPKPLQPPFLILNVKGVGKVFDVENLRTAVSLNPPGAFDKDKMVVDETLQDMLNRHSIIMFANDVREGGLLPTFVHLDWLARNPDSTNANKVTRENVLYNLSKFNSWKSSGKLTVPKSETGVTTDPAVIIPPQFEGAIQRLGLDIAQIKDDLSRKPEELQIVPLKNFFETIQDASRGTIALIQQQLDRNVAKGIVSTDTYKLYKDVIKDVTGRPSEGGIGTIRRLPPRASYPGRKQTTAA